MSALRIIFSGSGAYGLPSLQALLEEKHEIVQIFSQPDRPAGRGRKLMPTPIAALAMEKQLPLVRTATINEEPFPPADLMVVIAFGQKIAEHVVKHPRLGSFNLHASRLPKYRGAAPINWSIINGETISGNSIIRLAPKMDAGDILAQSEIAIGETETAGELHDRLAIDGAALVVETARKLANGEAVQTAQDETRATLAPKLSRASAVLDWKRPADALARQIRGMHPWPGCRVRLIASSGVESARLALVRARPGAPADAVPGTILRSACVAAGDGTTLEVIEVQPEGRRPMPLGDFRRGNRWEESMRLDSLS